MQEGYTPLMVASFIGHIDVVEVLLAHNANTETITKVAARFFLRGKMIA
jgi:ankyrin repeat protein